MEQRQPGPGLGALYDLRKEKELSGGAAHTTNNRMEMMAVIEAIRAVKRPCLLKFASDSALIINAMTKGLNPGNQGVEESR